MISLTTNVDDVILRVSNIERGLPSAIGEAFEPTQWLQLAKDSALARLQQMAAPAEQQYVPAFVDTVMTASFGGVKGGLPVGMRWTMQNVRAAAQHFARQTLSHAIESDMTKEEAFNFIKKLDFEEDLIKQWVDQAKKIEDPDPPAHEDIARNIRWILFGPRSDERLDATHDLIFGKTHSHGLSIGEFAKQLETPLSDDTVERWLAAVGQAWRELLLDLLPSKVRFHVLRLIRK